MAPRKAPTTPTYHVATILVASPCFVVVVVVLLNGVMARVVALGVVVPVVVVPVVAPVLVVVTVLFSVVVLAW